jgi:hypothetical protein
MLIKIILRPMMLSVSLMFFAIAITAGDFCKGHPDKNDKICEKQDGSQFGDVECVSTVTDTPSDCYETGFNEPPQTIG